MNNTGGMRSLTHGKHSDWFFLAYANMCRFSGDYYRLMDYRVAGVRDYILRGFHELV